ncbi:uncharacterized protein LOC143451611 [Clavelina lepadiformis]|uniref:uncharacterized protein LOC143451611 n=1 Tax=Clavelina lepadiformis TaxID=159417 RepID=UPI004042AA03
MIKMEINSLHANMELSEDVTNMLDKQNTDLYQSMQKIRKENLKLHRLAYAHKWSHRIMESNTSATEYLTGCPTYQIFLWLLRFLEKHVKSQGYNSMADQLLIMFMKAKLNVPNVFLSVLFKNVNIDAVVESWMKGFSAVYPKLIMYPANKLKEDEFVMNIIELAHQLCVAVVFTINGSICCVTEAQLCDSKTSMDNCNFANNLIPGNIVYDVKNGKCYQAHKASGGGVKLICNTKQNIMRLSKARSAINNTMERLCSFGIFRLQTIDELRFVNIIIKIAAIVANFHPAKVVYS